MEKVQGKSRLHKVISGLMSLFHTNFSNSYGFSIIPSMRHTIFVALLAVSFAFAGEFAHVSDPDRYVNIRSAPSNKVTVVETAKEGQCVEMFGSADGWTQVAVLSENSYVLGYIRGSRLVKDAKCKGKTIEDMFGKCAVSVVESNEAHTLKDLSKWYEKHSACRESDAIMNLSDLVAQEFANSWTKSFVEMEGKSAPLRAFIVELLSKSASVRYLQKIVRADCKITDDSKYCKEIQDAADKALK